MCAQQSNWYNKEMMSRRQDSYLDVDIFSRKISASLKENQTSLFPFFEEQFLAQHSFMKGQQE